MKSNKTYIALFLGLAAGFAIGVSFCCQFLNTTSIVPGWHTTVLPQYLSINWLNYSLAVVALGMSLGSFLPFFKKYFTQQRIEVANLGLAVVGVTVCLGYLWEIFVAWYSGYLYEQFAFYSSGHILLPWLISVCGVLLSQLFWIGKIRRNAYWSLVVAAMLVLGTLLEIAH